MPMPPPPLMVCTSTGDPHITTFSGHHCDLMGLGVFPLVQMGELVAQVYHCPASSNPSVSLNVGAALRFGRDVVNIAGTRAYVNGVEVSSGVTTTFGGGHALVHGGSEIEVLLTSGVTLSLATRTVGTSYLTSGYYQDVRLAAPVGSALASNTSSLCTAEQNNAIIGIDGDDRLFSTSVLSMLESACGTPASPMGVSFCGAPTSACDVRVRSPAGEGS